jgi:hypothetical protein
MRLIGRSVLVLTLLVLSINLPPATPTGALAPADQGAPSAPALERVVSNVFAPVFVTPAGDGSGRLFVVEKGGRSRSSSTARSYRPNF